MISFLEVLDTAVKIGLGAIVSVIGTYVLARFTHRKELEKFYLNRHVALLEATAEQVEKFTGASLDYWAALAEENDYAGQEVPKKVALERQSREESLIRSFNEVTTAEAKLLLLNEKNVYGSLTDYSSYVKGFLPIYRKGQSQLSSTDIDAFRSGIREKRFKFFESISSAYKRPHV